MNTVAIAASGRCDRRLRQGSPESQLRDVWSTMLDGGWWTISGLSARTGHPGTSVSARIRDFRKRPYGRHKVERRHVGRTVLYRLMPREVPGPKPKH